MNLWTLESHVGKLALDATNASIELERPERGLQALRVDGATIDGRLLALKAVDENPDWPAILIDSYVRGSDLVASYAGLDGWPYSPQVYWSAESIDADGAALPTLSLTVSIQTHLLDTHPRIVVESSLRADEALLIRVAGDEMLVDSHTVGVQSLDPQSTAAGFVWRLPGNKLSYAEIMPTSDFRQFSILLANGAIGSRWELFAEFLEKGVIRRARMRSVVVPRADDVHRIAEYCQAIERKPLPLTT